MKLLIDVSYPRRGAITCEESADVAEERCILMIVHPAVVFFVVVILMPGENNLWWGDWPGPLGALVSAVTTFRAVLA
jgi:hypothetical protein